MNYFLRTFTLLIFASLLFTVTGCNDDEDMMDEEMEEEMMMEEEPMTAVVWTGDTVTFTKENGADPTLEENQDRITDDVWITRGNTGGQIYNAVTESEADKDVSPAGTLWAVGTTANLSDLSFTTFREAVNPQPQDIVGIDLVMVVLGEDENIAIDVTFTNWTMGNQNGGGFAYERSSN